MTTQPQPTLLDEIAAIEARERSISQAEQNADPEWKSAALEAIRRLAERLPKFSTDEVWEVLHRVGFRTHEPRALGALMRLAAKDGVIVPTSEYVNSKREACHSRPVRVWASRIFVG